MMSFSMEDAMPTITIPEDVYQRLSERAAALHVTVEELVKPALDQLVGAVALSAEEARAEEAAFRAHLLNFPKFDGDFIIERDRDCGREIEF
jgi:hypothetical protein